MKTETPRIKQLTFQLGHTPCVLTRRALAAVAAAPSHPLPAGRSKDCLTGVGGVIAKKTDVLDSSPVFLSSQENARQFLPGPKAGVPAPEMK